MALPKVAVVGSCTSRDAFNRRFAPDYKSKVELVETVYQSSMPSLAREQAIFEEVPVTIQPKFQEVVRREYSGKNLSRLALAAADVLVIDFFADIHFGVTRLDDTYTTRNHMAFHRPSQADAYFKDEKLTSPDRMRYEASANASSYWSLAVASIKKVMDAVRGGDGSPLIVLNSARMSARYSTGDGGTQKFPNAQRLGWKNENWSEMDDVFQQLTSCARIEYPDELLVGDGRHPWGRHPVHYGQGYYDYFWDSLKAILNQD